MLVNGSEVAVRAELERACQVLPFLCAEQVHLAVSKSQRIRRQVPSRSRSAYGKLCSTRQNPTWWRGQQLVVGKVALHEI